MSKHHIYEFYFNESLTTHLHYKNTIMLTYINLYSQIVFSQHIHIWRQLRKKRRTWLERMNRMGGSQPKQISLPFARKESCAPSKCVWFKTTLRYFLSMQVREMVCGFWERRFEYTIQYKSDNLKINFVPGKKFSQTKRDSTNYIKQGDVI